MNAETVTASARPEMTPGPSIARMNGMRAGADAWR